MRVSGLVVGWCVFPGWWLVGACFRVGGWQVRVSGLVVGRCVFPGWWWLVRVSGVFFGGGAWNNFRSALFRPIVRILLRRFLRGGKATAIQRDSVERRAVRVESLVCMGKLSAGRQLKEHQWHREMTGRCAVHCGDHHSCAPLCQKFYSKRRDVE